MKNRRNICFKASKMKSQPPEAVGIVNGTPREWPYWLIYSRALRQRNKITFLMFVLYIKSMATAFLWYCNFILWDSCGISLHRHLSRPGLPVVCGSYAARSSVIPTSPSCSWGSWGLGIPDWDLSSSSRGLGTPGPRHLMQGWGFNLVSWIRGSLLSPGKNWLCCSQIWGCT